MERVTIHLEEQGIFRTLGVPRWLWGLMVKFYTDLYFRLPYEKPTLENFCSFIDMYPCHIPEGIKVKKANFYFIEYPYVSYKAMQLSRVTEKICWN